MLNIFIGYDSREDIAYRVAKYSLESRSTIPIKVIPIKQKRLRKEGLYTREQDFLASTEFSLTRFFVPYLMGFSGRAIFFDCDFLWTVDIKELAELFTNEPLQVVKHNYIPKEIEKMDGQIQSIYPKKNWSSMMVFNCEHPKNMILTLDFLNKAHPSTLHQFKWLDESEIGELPLAYNYLEGWYKEEFDGKPKAIHYTRGNVYFKNFQNVEYGQLWKDEYQKMTGQKWNNKLIIRK